MLGMGVFQLRLHLLDCMENGLSDVKCDGGKHLVKGF